MSVLASLQKARRAGLVITVEGADICVEGPQSALAIVDELRPHKTEILRILRASGNASREPPKAKRRAAKHHQQQPPPWPQRAYPDLPTRHNPAEVSYGGQSYHMARTRGMWFHARRPEYGWTCASREFLAAVGEELDRALAAAPR